MRMHPLITLTKTLITCILFNVSHYMHIITCISLYAYHYKHLMPSAKHYIRCIQPPNSWFVPKQISTSIINYLILCKCIYFCKDNLAFIYTYKAAFCLCSVGPLKSVQFERQGMPRSISQHFYFFPRCNFE